MAFLSKDQILNAEDLQTEVVNVPEWGGDVLVMGLTGAERDAFEASVVTQSQKEKGKGRGTKVDLTNFRAKLVAKSVVDPDTHDRLFSDAHAVQLGRKSAAALERVFDVARRLSGMSDEDVDELTGNSESDRNDASGSGSLSR